MGHLLSTTATDSQRAQQFCLNYSLLVSYLLDRTPSASAIKLAYNNNDSLGALFLKVRIPPYFTADLAQLRPICLFLLEDSPRDNESICNLVSAAVSQFQQPERMICCLVNLTIQQLKTLAVDEMKESLRLVKGLYDALDLIFYACGGDPSCFGSCSSWLKRLHYTIPIVEEMHAILSRHKTAFSSKGTNRRIPYKIHQRAISREDLESTLLELAIIIASVILETGHASDAHTLSSMALQLYGEFIVPTSKDYIQILYLIMGRACLVLERYSEAGQSLGSFVAGIEGSTLNALGLLSIDDMTLTETAAMYCLKLSKVDSVPEATISVSKSLLHLLPPCALPTLEALSLSDPQHQTVNARDQVHELLIKAYLELDSFDDAYDFVVQILDPFRGKRATENFCKSLIQRGLVDRLFGYPWGINEGTVESVIKDHVNQLPPTLQGAKVLFKWHISRDDLQSAATVMYRFAVGAKTGPEQSPEVYEALLMARNCLSLVKKPLQFIDISTALLPSPQIIDLSHIDNQMVLFKAQMTTATLFTNHTESVHHLLITSNLHLAMEIAFAAKQTQLDMAIGRFLFDSYVDSLKVDLERPWLEKILSFNFYHPEESTSPELAVLRFYMERRQCPRLSIMLLTLFLEQREVSCPQWLTHACIKSDADSLFRTMASLGNLDMVARLLQSDLGIRNQLSAGTIAFLELICNN